MSNKGQQASREATKQAREEQAAFICRATCDGLEGDAPSPVLEQILGRPSAQGERVQQSINDDYHGPGCWMEGAEE